MRAKLEGRERERDGARLAYDRPGTVRENEKNAKIHNLIRD